MGKKVRNSGGLGGEGGNLQQRSGRSGSSSSEQEPNGGAESVKADMYSEEEEVGGGSQDKLVIETNNKPVNPQAFLFPSKKAERLRDNF